MDAATRWWLENTAQGRKVQRRMLPESALGPRARREAQREREERENEELSFLTRRRGPTMMGLKLERSLPRRSAILGVESTASGNVVVRVGRETRGRAGVEQTEYVVLTRDEAHDLVHSVETALEGGP